LLNKKATGHQQHVHKKIDKAKTDRTSVNKSGARTLN
jgi:hypothetical protein